MLKLQSLILSFVLLGLQSLFSVSRAQEDVEYRMEIGAGAGLVSYEGDFNGSIVKNAQPMGAVMARYNFSPYMGLRLSAGFGKLKGNSTDCETYYPDFAENPYKFDKSLVDVSLIYEYNFWPYGTGRDYRGAKRITPFVFGGVGATSVSGDGKSVFTANIPLGIGVKYKIGERINLGFEWAAHFSLSDRLDGVEDPYGIKSSGLFKNTDCYSAFQLSLTYSFMPKCRTCHNYDED
jgi:hypothetical protein